MDGFQTAGDGRRNQLGGMYLSGKPLSQELRSRIVNLSCLGLRQCDISRQLKVTHGCISKLLSKYQETGNMDPAHNAGRPRVITAEIEKKIDQYRRADPGAFCWELREYLLRDNVCTVEEVPSLSSISRLLKNKIINEAVEKKKIETNRLNKCEKGNQSSPFSIASILNIKSDEEINQQPNCKKLHYPKHPLNADRFNEVWCGNRSSPTMTIKMHLSEGHPRPQRRVRTKFNRVQSLELEREFQKNPYPGIQRRVELACQLAIDESRIQVWFANRRAKGRRRVVSKEHLVGNEKNRSPVCLEDLSSLQTSEFSSLYQYVNKISE